MPPKSRNNPQNQPKLSFSTTHDKQPTPPTNRQALEQQIAKLLKLRKQLDKKKMEQHRIMGKIINLQMHDLVQIRKPPTLINQDEQYLIITKSECLEKIEKISLLKLIAQDYGEVIICKKQSQNELQPSSQIQQLKQSLQAKAEWQQHGNLKQQYLVQYQPDFINVLNTYQYIADQVSNPNPL